MESASTSSSAISKPASCGIVTSIVRHQCPHSLLGLGGLPLMKETTNRGELCASSSRSDADQPLGCAWPPPTVSAEASECSRALEAAEPGVATSWCQNVSFSSRMTSECPMEARPSLVESCTVPLSTPTTGGGGGGAGGGGGGPGGEGGGRGGEGGGVGVVAAAGCPFARGVRLASNKVSARVTVFFMTPRLTDYSIGIRAGPGADCERPSPASVVPHPLWIASCGRTSVNFRCVIRHPSARPPRLLTAIAAPPLLHRIIFFS